MINPKNIIRHELIGLEVEVKDSKNDSQIGIKGNIINETKNVIVIKTKRGLKKIQKLTSIFVFKLPDKRKVKVDGKVINFRPEDRVSKRVKKW